MNGSRNHNAPPDIRVDRAVCIVCGACSAVCPTEALLAEGLELVVYPDRCRPCARASVVCPTGALKCPRPNGRTDGDAAE